MIRVARNLHFKSPDDLMDWWEKYESYCSQSKDIQTKVGFVVYMRKTSGKKYRLFSESTLHRYREREGFRECLEAIDAACADSAINNEARTPVIRKLILHSYGYSDRQQIDQTVENKGIEVSIRVIE
jgi:transcription elongation factor GreA-like protein